MPLGGFSYAHYSWPLDFLVPVLVSLRTVDNSGINLSRVVTRPLSDTWAFQLALLLGGFITLGRWLNLSEPKFLCP